MNDNDLITRREVELALLEKGQKTERYKWGEQWELNFSEIREALSKYQSKTVRCKDCKHYRINTVYPGTNMIMTYCAKTGIAEIGPEWFCADGKRQEGR